jgi:CheY-like chemotaxis protein
MPKILVIDDDAIVRITIVQLLEEAGHQVLWAVDQWKAAPQRAVDQGILRGLRAVERHLSTQAADQDNPRGWLHTYIDAS